MKIEWRPLAEQDLAEIVGYIALESPRAAYEVHDRLREATAILADHPNLDRPGRLKGTRELVVTGTPFIVGYRVERRGVSILRVLHGARRWPDSR